MKRGILFALVAVPLLAQAAPRKPAKKTGTPAPEPMTPTPAPAPAPTPGTSAAGAGSGAAAAPTTPAPGQPTQTPSGGNGAGGNGQGGPAGPAATDGGTEVEPSDGKAQDVDTLRQEYLALRDELFKSRARAHAVAGQLYSTRMQIKFTWGSARSYGVSKASIRLDGATVYEDAGGAIASDDGIRFDGFVAPGRHLVTFHVEAAGKDDDSFTSTTEAQVTVKAIANKDLVVTAKGRDNGDIAYAWKKTERGSYGLGIDVAVKSVAQTTRTAKAGK